MYIHSVKVPRLYKDAAKILKDIKETNGSLKTLIFKSKHCNKKGLSALVHETLRRFSVIDCLIEKTQLLTKENRFNPWLARILITELLWGKKQLPDQSVPVKTLLTYQKKLEKYKSKFNSTIDDKPKAKVHKSRVVRVNTILTSVENVVSELKNEDFKLMPFTGESYEEFISQCASLNENEFMIDFHYNELLHFPFVTEFYHYNAYKNGLLVLQDKASCIPARLLNVQPGSTVLDMCAAPGMKTTHLAALLNNNGTIYAVERDPERFKTLNTFVQKLGASCVKTINQDVLKLKAKNCSNVEYILVDPTCSGTGMTDRVEFNEDAKPSKERLKRLAGFQILILKHALKHFPQAKRIIYSTCSVYTKENEFVIREVLKNDIDFKLINAQELLKGSWTSTKKEKWKDITENCLCLQPEKDLTNGFFIAVFERFRDANLEKMESQINKNINTEKNECKKKMKKSKKEDDGVNDCITHFNNENINEVVEENAGMFKSSNKDIEDVTPIQTNETNTKRKKHKKIKEQQVYESVHKNESDGKAPVTGMLEHSKNRKKPKQDQFETAILSVEKNQGKLDIIEDFVSNKHKNKKKKHKDKQ